MSDRRVRTPYANNPLPSGRRALENRRVARWVEVNNYNDRSDFSEKAKLRLGDLA